MKIPANPKYDFFPLSEIRPAGWLRRQLKIQADGLSGHLDQIWPDIADSRWIGGENEGWERVPYWLDGFIPLAWLLDDQDMQIRASRYIDKILEGQQPDGWICPCSEDERPSYDLWALFLILKTLTVYHDATADPRIERAVELALRQLDRHIDNHLLFGWAQTRWYEALISIFWLHRRKPGQWLIDLAVKLHSQGFDFPALYAQWPYQKPSAKGHWSQMNHVVNQAMMLKGWSLYSLISGKNEDRQAAVRMLASLDEWHGQASGVFSGDECLAGRSPVQGTELCAVVEMMYSLEWLLAIDGEASWGDRLEQIAFNALPATFSPDMWTHQYDQQANQIACTRQDETVFLTNGGDANLFGLEPNFGCCTANLSQGWPKFARSTLLRSTDEDGIMVASYAPVQLKTRINGILVKLNIETDYPFHSQVRLKISTEKPVSFPLWLRIPQWCSQASLEGAKESVSLIAGQFSEIRQIWAGQTELVLQLPMQEAWHERPHDMLTLSRGPLVYAIDIPARWQQVLPVSPGHEFPHTDYELYPEGNWAFGVAERTLTWQENPCGPIPFSPKGTPLEAWLLAYPLDWPQKNGTALPEPLSRIPIGSPQKIRLIPYGCTNLRLTELPQIEKPD